MAQTMNQPFIDYSFYKEFSTGTKTLRVTQSSDDFTSLELNYGLPHRKRVWSSDVFPHEDSMNGGHDYINSQRDIGDSTSTSTSCSSKKVSKKEKKKATREDFVAKFKTEICKYWEEKGKCPYGKRCAFAHGGDEKRHKTCQKEHKISIKCINFYQNSFCAYGRRCQYKHFSDAKSSCFYQERLNDPNYFELHNNDCVCARRPRLSVFEEITSKSDEFNSTTTSSN